MKLVVQSVTLAIACLVLSATSANAATPPQTPEDAELYCKSALQDGELDERRGRSSSALERLDACSRTPECTKAIRDDCTRMRDDIDRRLPSIRIIVRDTAGTEIIPNTGTPMSITIDGEPFSGRVGYPSSIEPGPHDIECVVGDYEPVRTHINAREGEKNRVVDIVLASGARRNPGDAQPIPVLRPKLGPIVLAGIGLVMTTGAVVSYLLAKLEDRDIEHLQTARDDTTRPLGERDAFARDVEEHTKQRDTNFVVSIGLGVGGFVCLGAAAAWYFLLDSTPAQPAQPATSSSSNTMKLAPRRDGFVLTF